MERQDDKELWDLLGKTPQPLVRGNFADNVLREIRMDGSQEKPASRHWLRWLVAPSVAGMAVLLMLNIHPVQDTSIIPAKDLALITEAVGQLAVNDINDVVHLDDLDDMQNDNENNVWLGTASF